MKYMRSKSRIKKHIVPILQQMIDDNQITTYVEPFVGGANVIDSIMCKNKLGYDNHEYLIELFKQLQKDENCLPHSVSKDHYDSVRDCFNKGENTYPKWHIGAVGFLASYNGRWFDGGYSGKRIGVNGKERDYFDESKRNLQSQRERLLDIKFDFSDYKDIGIPSRSLIYCDIPYQNVKKYSTSKDFSHEDFWEWARNVGRDNIIVVSEQTTPNDFKSIWEKEVKLKRGL